MMRVIWVYARGKALSFAPARPEDRPVFGALVHQVGVRIHPDTVVVPRAGAEAIRPWGLVLAARHRLFRLRVHTDRLFPHDRRPVPGARARARGRPVAPPAPPDGVFVVSGRAGPVYAVRAASLDEARAWVAGQHERGGAWLEVVADSGQVRALGLCVFSRDTGPAPSGVTSPSPIPDPEGIPCLSR